MSCVRPTTWQALLARTTQHELIRHGVAHTATATPATMPSNDRGRLRVHSPCMSAGIVMMPDPSPRAKRTKSPSHCVFSSLTSILPVEFHGHVKTKNFHWHMSGPHFRDYHLMLDEQSDQIFATTDVLAERVRKLGQLTLHSIGEISRNQRIADNDAAIRHAAGYARRASGR